jgi:hypothetical protein
VERKPSNQYKERFYYPPFEYHYHMRAWVYYKIRIGFIFCSESFLGLILMSIFLPHQVCFLNPREQGERTTYSTKSSWPAATWDMKTMALTQGKDGQILRRGTC